MFLVALLSAAPFEMAVGQTGGRGYFGKDGPSRSGTFGERSFEQERARRIGRRLAEREANCRYTRNLIRQGFAIALPSYCR
jgi:hypothetical protein